MNKKASVTAKTQNRTALGVLHAYAALNPAATLADLRAAFPNSICPDSGVKENILPLADAEAYNASANMSLFFVKDEEVLHLYDGTDVCLCQIWTKGSLDRLTAAAANFGIEVTDPDKSLEYDKSGFIATLFVRPEAPAPAPAPAPEPAPAPAQPLKPEPAPFTAGGMTIITPANYTIGKYCYSEAGYSNTNCYKQRPKDVTVLAGEGQGLYVVCDGLATSKVTELANALGVSYGSDWFAHRIAQEVLKKVLGDKFATPKRGVRCVLYNVAIFNDYLILHEYTNDGCGDADSIKRSCYVYQKR